jgi:hypothetical protein
LDKLDIWLKFFLFEKSLTNAWAKQGNIDWQLG